MTRSVSAGTRAATRSARPQPFRRTLAALLLLAIAAGCDDGPPTSVPSQATPTATGTASPSPTPSPTASATPTPLPLFVRSSIGQLLVEDATPGLTLELRGPDGARLQTGEVDAQGVLVFRDLPPAPGYVVASVDSPAAASRPVDVWSVDDVPPADFYAAQQLQPGFQYITTRDGTQLAVNVTLPGPIDAGPWPTVIEYSGYDVSNPAAPQVSSLIASVLGYAVVGVNLRGTGCSGGAFDLFEAAHGTDGYDAVEIVARQPWVAFNRVGMVGTSYPGILQLYVAGLRPPHLAAIAPLAATADFGRGILYPGGIPNDGFPLGWLVERRDQAAPFGQPSAVSRRDQGDAVCIENQRFRGQNRDPVALLGDDVGAAADAFARLAPDRLVDRIDVPVFLAGAWQDESVGPGLATMLGNFGDSERLFFTLTNGSHSEAMMPAIASRYVEFLSFYVRREIPALTPRVRQGIALIGRLLFGATRVDVEPDRFTDAPDYAGALARFEAEPNLRILFENGAGSAMPGVAVARFEHSFADWPIADTTPATWHLDANGRLAAEPPPGEGADLFHADSSLAQVTTAPESPYTGVPLPDWTWPQPADGAALGYETDPLDATLVMVGTGSVDLWLQSTAADTDLQVVLSEVRSDGNETYVQTGYLRASHRAVAEGVSTPLRPVHTLDPDDATPLAAGAFQLVRIELPPFGHVFRAGSRIRIVVSTPGGTQPLWTFAVLAPDQTVNTIARSAQHPSRVVLPVVPGIDVPEDLPPCPSLRFQYCRPYERIRNNPARGGDA